MAEEFGKYELIRKVARGGMAEVFLARQRGEIGGFTKDVAIKRIFPHLADDPELVKMFLDEARIAASLNHPNIVQIYDLGQVEEHLFIAMEFVDGHDLRTIAERAWEKEDFMPMNHAVSIVSKVASALHYAHERKDDDGNPLQIVHRDVSPQNILVSFDGHVKVCDFGIAKAENRLAQTQVGQFKGKFGYLSPEQISGGPLDARSDVFTLGVVLYELTCQFRLFDGDTDAEIIRRVEEADFAPPSDVKPGFPLDLERIIMRALEKERAHRFANAEEMHIDLENWLTRNQQPVRPKDISQYLKGLFDLSTGDRDDLTGPLKMSQRQMKSLDAHYEEDETVIIPAAQSAAQSDSTGPLGAALPQPSLPVPQASREVAPTPKPVQQPAPAAQSSPAAHPTPVPSASQEGPARRPSAPPTAAKPPGGAAKKPGPAQTDSSFDQDHLEPSRPLQRPDISADLDTFAPRSNKKAILATLALFGAFAIIGLVFLLQSERTSVLIDQAESGRVDPELLAQEDEREPLETVSMRIDTNPAGAYAIVNGVVRGSTDDTIEILRGVNNQVVLYLDGYAPQTVDIEGVASPSPIVVDLAEHSPTRVGELSVVTEPAGATIWLNGKEVGKSPASLTDLSANYPHHVLLSRDGYGAYAGFIQLVPDSQNIIETQLPELGTPRARRVELIVAAIPRGTIGAMEGERGSTPFRRNEKPDAFVSVHLTEPDHQALTKRISLEDVATFELRPHLTPARRQRGHISITATPEATIYVGPNAHGNEVSRLQLPEGQHKVVFEAAWGRFDATVEVVGNEHISYDARIGSDNVQVNRR